MRSGLSLASWALAMVLPAGVHAEDARLFELSASFDYTLVDGVSVENGRGGSVELSWAAAPSLDLALGAFTNSVASREERVPDVKDYGFRLDVIATYWRHGRASLYAVGGLGLRHSNFGRRANDDNPVANLALGLRYGLGSGRYALRADAGYSHTFVSDSTVFAGNLNDVLLRAGVSFAFGGVGAPSSADHVAVNASKAAVAAEQDESEPGLEPPARLDREMREFDPVPFAAAQPHLGPLGRATTDRIAQEVLALVSEAAPYQVLVVGYSATQTLSEQRAESVRVRLVRAGVPPSRVLSGGRGSDGPPPPLPEYDGYVSVRLLEEGPVAPNP